MLSIAGLPSTGQNSVVQSAALLSVFVTSLAGGVAAGCDPHGEAHDLKEQNSRNLWYRAVLGVGHLRNAISEVRRMRSGCHRGRAVNDTATVVFLLIFFCASTLLLKACGVVSQ